MAAEPVEGRLGTLALSDNRCSSTNTNDPHSRILVHCGNTGEGNRPPQIRAKKDRGLCCDDKPTDVSPQ
jgi:hypothetical protein